MDSRLACLYHTPYISLGECTVSSKVGGKKTVIGMRVGRHLFVHRDIGVTYTVRDFQTGERLAVNGVPFGLLEKAQALKAAKAVDFFITDASQGGACISMAADQTAKVVWWHITDGVWDWSQFEQMVKDGFANCQKDQLDWRQWLEEVYGK